MITDNNSIFETLEIICLILIQEFYCNANFY